jgi:hypothetical protein
MRGPQPRLAVVLVLRHSRTERKSAHRGSHTLVGAAQPLRSWAKDRYGRSSVSYPVVPASATVKQPLNCCRRPRSRKKTDMQNVRFLVGVNYGFVQALRGARGGS